jgi:ionotropic glutamate receptor
MNITANQTKYLIQVMPPSDIIPQIVQLVASQQNMTNAAVLYDESFGNFSNLISVYTFFI